MKEPFARMGALTDSLRDLSHRIARRIPFRNVSGSLRIAPVGFHGDRYLIELTDLALSGATHFIETGTNVGSTLRHAAERHKRVQCFSCEPDAKVCEIARTHTRALDNVRLLQTDSITFLNELAQIPGLFSGNPVFWLDAHGFGFEWPLREEVRFVTGNFERGRMWIDDFKVPGMPMFGYDRYCGQECGMETIHDCLDQRHTYRITYPDYTERSSAHHPLRGWVLFEFGDLAPLAIPEGLRKNLRRETFNTETSAARP